MPDYGQPIENDLNFNSLLDFFRAKGKKDKAPDVKIPMGPRGPKTMRGLPKGDETQEFVKPKDKEASVDVDKDDDMADIPGKRQGGHTTKKRVYGNPNPKPTPITPTPKKPVNKAADEDDKGKLRGNPETYIGDTPGYTQQEQADKAAMMSPPTERRFHNRLQGQGVGEEMPKPIRVSGKPHFPDTGGVSQPPRTGDSPYSASQMENIHRMANDPSHEWHGVANETLDMLSQEGYGVAGRELALPKHGFSPMAGGGIEVGRPQTQARGTIPSHPDEQKRIGIQNTVENSLLKLMKDGDTQELNPMEDPPKENKESQALVADGDSKRPKSEVGTNDKMFKKAHDWQAGEGPEPWQTDKAKRWARIKRNVEAKRANKATQETLPGFEPEPPEEEPPTPDELEHNVLKVMEHPEDRPRSTQLSRNRLRQLREGDTLNPAGLQRTSKPWNPLDETPHTVPEDLPVKVRNSVENSLLKLMKTEEPRSRQAMEAEFPVRHPDDTIDPTIRVSSRTGIDAPVLPDPTQPETTPEQLQREAEGKRDKRTRGGRESGAMGVRRGKPVPDYRPGRSHMTGGAMESRKVRIGMADDMEKGGTFWGGSRKQDIRQNQPMARQGEPWGREKAKPSQEAGMDRQIERLVEARKMGNPPRMGNLGEVRGQRKKSIEKENLGGQGISGPSEGFDPSVPMPRPKVTGKDHPEGPGKRLINGFTTKEHNKMKKDDKAGVSRADYPQGADVLPTTPELMRTLRTGQATRKSNWDRVKAKAKNPIEESIEKSLLKLMKEGEIIPSKVGMTRKNAARDLEKVNPQAMQGNPKAIHPVAPRATPVANPTTSATADQIESGSSSSTAPDVGSYLAYGSLGRAAGGANWLTGIKQPGDETATAPEIVGGGLKAGAKGVGAVASGIKNLFGGGKKQPEAPTPSSGLPPPNQNWED